VLSQRWCRSKAPPVIKRDVPDKQKAGLRKYRIRNWVELNKLMQSNFKSSALDSQDYDPESTAFSKMLAADQYAMP
jgi:hypothetical protein